MAKDSMPSQKMCISILAVTRSLATAFAIRTTQVHTNEMKNATKSPMQTANMTVMRKFIFVSFLYYKDKDFKGHTGERGAARAAPNPCSQGERVRVRFPPRR